MFLPEQNQTQQIRNRLTYIKDTVNPWVRKDSKLSDVQAFIEPHINLFMKSKLKYDRLTKLKIFLLPYIRARGNLMSL